MKTVRILHLADVHIGAAESFLKETAKGRRYETLITFEKIIDEAVKLGVELIAIAGDLFDSNRIEDSFIKGVFAKIGSVNIPVVFAAGNHDPLNAESPFLRFDLPENLYVLGTNDECITFENLSLKVYGRSFENAFLKGEQAFSLKTDDDYINLLVQHGELSSDLNSQYNAITPAFVKNSGMDYIALGHVHKRSEKGKIDKTSFAYCGCPEGQGFDELDQKGVYICEVGKGDVSLEFLPISKRRHIEFDCDITEISNSSDVALKVLDELKAKTGDDFRENLYKIKLIGSIPTENDISIEEIERRLAEELYFVKINDNTEFLLDLEALSKEASLRGVFVKNMLALIESDKEQEPLYRKALNLGLKAFNGEVKYNED